MFTGIIECTGEIQEIKRDQSNIHFKIRSRISNELKIDQSVSHDGVCLTVTKVEGDTHEVTAIEETLRKSNLSGWQTGTTVNLERSMVMNGRLDGHIVQGHVDQVGECIEKKDEKGSWLFTFKFRTQTGALLVEKGSICINGVSLTCFNVKKDQFSVAIIPYTFEHTSFKFLEQGNGINLEFDVVGKYLEKLFNQYR